jgi:modulator of FtsH protease
MNDETVFARDVAAPRERSVAGVFGWVMGLVAISIGFLGIGAWVGRDLSHGAALALSLAGFGMLMVTSFAGQRFRVGSFAIGWLFATAAVIGLGIGPMIAYYTSVNQDAVIQAALGTACTVLAMGAVGMLMAKDLAPLMRPLSIVMLVVFGGIMIWSIFAGPMNPIFSLLIYGLSAFALVVDFNYLRKHGTEDDAVLLATGIFVSIVNIFLSLLNLFGR